MAGNKMKGICDVCKKKEGKAQLCKADGRGHWHGEVHLFKLFNELMFQSSSTNHLCWLCDDCYKENNKYDTRDKVIEWDKDAKPIPKPKQVIQDAVGLKWKVIKVDRKRVKGNPKLTLVHESHW